MSEQRATAPPLCAGGCGFYGSPATFDMCSVCYRQHCLVNGGEPGVSSTAAATKAVAKAAANATVVTSGAVARSPAPATDACFVASTETKGAAAAAAASVSSQPEAATTAPANRCAACKKKVGLTGFACRCGATFCGTHRYPEKHACGFDFKAAGRDAIACANPLIKGDKLGDRI